MVQGVCGPGPRATFESARFCRDTVFSRTILCAMFNFQGSRNARPLPRFVETGVKPAGSMWARNPVPRRATPYTVSLCIVDLLPRDFVLHTYPRTLISTDGSYEYAHIVTQ